ncbi:MAG: hypothetical protein NT007_11660 [Candidatus Kapabacteria bacterium]|nr:hypothetical protein [Candidatus Kapabacteria bacterium]
MSFLRMQESQSMAPYGIPAFAGMTAIRSFYQSLFAGMTAIRSFYPSLFAGMTAIRSFYPSLFAGMTFHWKFIVFTQSLLR